MAVLTVSLPELTDIAEFVNIMARFPYEAHLTVGNYSVDAKSIMGIFTLDREQPMLLETETEDADAVEALAHSLGKFLVNPVH
ncbi:MAG: HPr family phosphocarrier protein [Oscillospiraceae bacterium]|nr:HPr family phosphocarrier protein [Oscillospiraceae bacterium]